MLMVLPFGSVLLHSAMSDHHTGSAKNIKAFDQVRQRRFGPEPELILYLSQNNAPTSFLPRQGR